MDIEERLKLLQALYCGAQTAALSTKAHYEALAAQPEPGVIALMRARASWLQSEARKTELIARMVALEELELDVVE